MLLLKGSFVSAFLLVISLIANVEAANGFSKRLVPPQTPATDPFYQAPAGYEFLAPGTVIRSRSFIPAGLGLIVDILSVRSYQVLFRTNGINNKPIVSVVTILSPLLAPNDRFVSFANEEDSSASICAPSYNYQFLAFPSNLLVQADLLVVQAYLLSGYTVSIPDHEGPDSAFAVGRLAGRVVLDSMRATQNFKDLGLKPNSMVAGVGYSGGAIAVGWAAQLQPTYAPEINIASFAIGGVPANLTGTFAFVDGTTFSGFLPPAIVGFQAESAYPELRQLVNRVATPAGQQALQFASTHCVVDDILSFAFQKVADKKFSSLGDRILYDPQVAGVLNDNLMGSNAFETPTKPILIYHASQDEIIPYANTSTLVDTYCNRGAAVHFTTYQAGGHLTTIVDGLPQTLQWVADGFAGKLKNNKGCQRDEKLDSPLDPIALGVELEPVLIGLINILAKLGEGDSNVQQNLHTLNQTATVPPLNKTAIASRQLH